MILHCWYCSLGGERMAEHSAVAIVKEQAVHRPVNPTMFSPLNGIEPFMPGVGWRYMTHRACGKYPWPQAAVMPTEGPLKILTDTGIIDVPKKFECEECGRAYKTGPALKRHITMEHKKWQKN
jgi:hypothetical protein